MKKKIGIEALLRWAFNEELCKNMPIAASAWDMVERFGALGVRVDAGHNGSQGFGFLDGTPHADAQAVAAAIRGLPKLSCLPNAVSAASLAGPFGELLDADAQRLLKAAKFNAPALVIRCATFKNRPEWNVGDPELQPLNGATGTAIVYGLDAAAGEGARPEFKAARKDAAIEAWIAPERRGELSPMKAHPKRGGYDLDRGPRCLIAWQSPAPFEFAEARAEYVIWRTAILDIAEQLAADDALIAHELTADFPPAEPWNEPAPAPAQPLASTRKVSDIPLAASPRRDPARPPLRYQLPRTGESRRKLARSDIA